MPKPCFKCGETKPLSAFYKHSSMADGHLGKCKECTKADVRKHHQENLEACREYHRSRGYRGKPGYTAEYRKRFPNKYKAHNMVNNAKRDGYLHEEPCYKCGSEEKLHGHHDDYLKPLEIRWLCCACHKAWHQEHGEGANP